MREEAVRPRGVEARGLALRHGPREAHRGPHLRDALGPRPQDAQRAEALDGALARRRAVLGGGAGRVEPRARALHEGGQRPEGRARSPAAARCSTSGSPRANKALLEMHRSEEFLEAQRRMTRSSTEYRLAEREIAEAFCEMHHIPTRTEMDEMQRAVTELRARACAARCNAPKPREAAREATARQASKTRRKETPMRVKVDPQERSGIHRVQRPHAAGARAARADHATATCRSPPRPKREVWRQDKAVLYHYEPIGEEDGQDAGADGLRADRPLHHGRPAGGPLAGAQPARRRASTSTWSTGARPRAATGGSPSRTTSTATSATASTSSARSRASTTVIAARHLRGRRLHHLLRGAQPEEGEEPDAHHHADRLPRRRRRTRRCTTA